MSSPYDPEQFRREKAAIERAFRMAKVGQSLAPRISLRQGLLLGFNRIADGLLHADFRAFRAELLHERPDPEERY